MGKSDFSALIGKAKEKQIKTPIQKIVSIKEKKDETLFSLYIPSDRLKALKIKSAEENISIKELINSAIDEKYFKENNL
jgi:hypothetical protein